MKKLTAPHYFNLALALFAFGLFVTNQFQQFSGGTFDLRGTTGAVVLTVFLAAGIIGQFAKIIVGHNHWTELVVTLILLAAHIVAEVTIWVRTQIMGIGIPPTLPLWIVGLYWVVGAIDIIALFAGRELALFAGESQYDRMSKELEEARLKLALAQQAEQIASRTAQQLQSAIPQQPAAVQPQQSYTATCPDCGQVLTATSKRGLTNALNAHKRWCTGQSSTNGHKEARLEPSAE